VSCKFYLESVWLKPFSKEEIVWFCRRRSIFSIVFHNPFEQLHHIEESISPTSHKNSSVYRAIRENRFLENFSKVRQMWESQLKSEENTTIRSLLDRILSIAMTLLLAATLAKSFSIAFLTSVSNWVEICFHLFGSLLFATFHTKWSNVRSWTYLTIAEFCDFAFRSLAIVAKRKGPPEKRDIRNLTY
jgi:hypothetical protein